MYCLENIVGNTCVYERSKYNVFMIRGGLEIKNQLTGLHTYTNPTPNSLLEISF